VTPKQTRSIELSPGPSLTDLIERRAASQGAATAIIVDDCTVTFTELNEAARGDAGTTTGITHSETDLAQFCARHLAVYKRPLRFIPIDRFPMVVSPNGWKVQRNKLREMAQEAMA
jgi:acyl-CoA synthetase (AMP-forming)/AMP-acid ligase II